MRRERERAISITNFGIVVYAIGYARAELDTFHLISPPFSYAHNYATTLSVASKISRLCQSTLSIDLLEGPTSLIGD